MTTVNTETTNSTVVVTKTTKKLVCENILGQIYIVYDVSDMVQGDY